MLDGKVAIVTGAGRGLGREEVLLMAKEGCNLVVNDLGAAFDGSGGETKVADQVAEECRNLGVKAVANYDTVTDFNKAKAMVDQAISEFGKLDILVNNAGITRDGLIMRMSAEEWQSVISVNLNSAFYLSKALTRHMIKRRSGAIINISSIVGVIGNAGQSNYSASKAGLIGLTKSLAREIAGRNVRVNAVAPGFIRSAMTEKLSEKQQEAFFARIPMARFGEPEEVAKAVLFLASDLSSYITGHVLHITGGLGM